MDSLARLLKIQLPLNHTATKQFASMTPPTTEKELLANGRAIPPTPLDTMALDTGSQISDGSAEMA
jgi:hypothetical protein